MLCLVIISGSSLSKLDFENKVDSKNARIGVFQGFMMQFVNPKAWIVAITGAGAFLPHFDNVHLNVFVFAISYGLVGIPCMILWVSFGEVISRLLRSEKAHRFLSIGLFVLMLSSIVMMWL